jgi:hypothetical protein
MVEQVRHPREGRLEMRRTRTPGTDRNRQALLRGGVAGLLAFLVLLLVPAHAAWSDPSSQCGVHVGPNGAPPGLAATIFSTLNYDVPAGVNSVSGSATAPLYPSWNILFTNDSPETVTDPTITITSGLDPAVFGGELPEPTLPSSCSQPSLEPNGTMNLGFAARGSVHDASLGFDSSAVATPNVLPATGGEVTERFTVTLTDPGLAGASVTVSTGNGDVSVVSQSVPQNLDQGETITTTGNEWDLSNAQLDKPYVFTALVTVGNAGAAAAPYVFSATGFIRVNNPRSCVPCLGVSTQGSSVTVPDANLDGAFTLSVDQPDEFWSVFHAPTVEIHYPETNVPLACKNGGWQSYGIFKNQGDCVSYVASDGRNAPAGSS